MVACRGMGILPMIFPTGPPPRARRPRDCRPAMAGQRYIDGNTELHLAIKRETPTERQPHHGGVSFSPYSLRLCVNLLFPSCLLRLGRLSARDGGITGGD